MRGFRGRAQSKYYRGGDLRFFFGNQLNEVFADLGGASLLLGTATGFSGRTIQFGSLGGAVVAPTLEPIQGQGGFLQLGLPLSRIFNANPTGRNEGWSAYFTYGLDSAFAKDARRGNGMLRSDYGAAQLRYKLNRWVTLVHEETYIDTHVVSGVPLKLFRGNPARTVHAWRTEIRHRLRVLNIRRVPVRERHSPQSRVSYTAVMRSPAALHLCECMPSRKHFPGDLYLSRRGTE